MSKLLFPIILIGLAAVAFFTYINPTYADVQTLKAQYAEYDQALSNARALKERMATLAGKSDQTNPADLTRLETMLPDSVNNVRLIRDLNQLGAPIGITINNVVFEVQDASNAAVPSPAAAADAKKDYGVFNITFSISGTYQNFVNFMSQLDKSLRLIDVSSIAFTATNSAQNATAAAGVYRYDFKVKTYWLKQ